MYYMIYNKTTGQYYWQKSNDPNKSIESHIRRANDPTSQRYYTPLHTALREEGTDNFNFFIMKYPPKWATHFGRYMT